MSLLKKLGVSSVVALAAVSLAACGSKKDADKSAESSKPLTLWVDTQQVGYYKKIVKEFNKKYPKIKVRVTQSPNGSAQAKTDVGKDPAKAADVFEVPNDQLGQMAESGYINPLSPDAVKQIKADNVPEAYKGVEWKGKVYAYPFAEQAQTLYYNKSKLSASDVKDWKTLTSKGVVATDFTNAYTMFPVFFTAGNKLFGTNGEDPKGSTVASENGVAALKWFAEQKGNKGVMQTSNGLNQLKKDKAQAILDGPWNAANIKKILGKNFAVTVYPKINVAGKDAPMQAFLGIEGFAVNSHTSNAKNATLLAAFITNKAAQLVAHKEAGQIPVNKAAQASDEIKNDDVAKAVIAMAKKQSVLMPKLSQMAIFWDGASPLISGAYDGKIKADQFKAQLDKFAAKISKKN